MQLLPLSVLLVELFPSPLISKDFNTAQQTTVQHPFTKLLMFSYSASSLPSTPSLLKKHHIRDGEMKTILHSEYEEAWCTQGQGYYWLALACGYFPSDCIAQLQCAQLAGIRLFGSFGLESISYVTPNNGRRTYSRTYLTKQDRSHETEANLCTTMFAKCGGTSGR